MAFASGMSPRWPKHQVVFLILAFLCLGCPSTHAVRRLTKDLTVKFFSDVSMPCDHIELNITANPEVESISWLFPDGSLRSGENDLANMTKFSFSAPGSDVTVAAERTKFAAYNLSVSQVDDAEFGYYSCVVVFTVPPTNDGDRVAVIRWGLNIDGADYSELIEHYKESAIIGGVAAAAMLLVVGGGCILWHCSYAKRHEEESMDKEGFEEDGIPVVEMDDAVVDHAAKFNKGFQSDIKTTEVDAQ